MFESDTPNLEKGRLRAAVPPGSTIVLYKTPEEFGAAFSRGENLEWIRHERQALPIEDAGAPRESLHIGERSRENSANHLR